MEKAENYSREANNVLRKENTEANFTVRLHFAKDGRNGCLVGEIQKILTETYIRSLSRSGD